MELIKKNYTTKFDIQFKKPIQKLAEARKGIFDTDFLSFPRMILDLPLTKLGSFVF